MEPQSNVIKQESIIHEEIKSRSASSLESVKPKISPTRRLSKKSSSHSGIRRFDAICPVVFQHCNSILNIRPRDRVSGNADDQSPLITINISGTHFQTYLSTLQAYPDTLLGNEYKRLPYWNSTTQEYFFDRHRACFESILYFYQSNGRLRRPDFVPLDTFLEEIAFFQLGSQALAQVHENENISVVTQIPMPHMLWRRCLWYYLEFPQHSYLARAINLFSMLFTIVSCIALAVETLPDYNHHWENICKERAQLPLNSTYVPRCSALFTSPFFIIQTVCVTYFTIEFLLRLASTPSYFRFLLSVFNWIDLGAIVPYFVFLRIVLAEKEITLDANVIMGFRLLRILRFARISKVYLLFHRLKALRVLRSTLKESLAEFGIIITISGLVAFLFGAVVYFVEQEKNGDIFDSIPKATYWGIITITGVGYGDMYPVTPIGRILTCLCALFGAGMMGMLISVLVERYQRVYNRKMYVPEEEIPVVEFKRLRSSQNGEEDVTEYAQRPDRRQKLAFVTSQGLTSFQKRFQTAQPRLSAPSYKVQFSVTFGGENIDSHEAASIVKSMEEKMTEALPDAGANIKFKLMEMKDNRLWTTYNASSIHNPNSTDVRSPNNSTAKRWRSQGFEADHSFDPV